MDSKELLPKTAHELQRMAAELRDQMRTERFKVATRQQGKVHTLRVLRKDLARIAQALHGKAASSTPTNV